LQGDPAVLRGQGIKIDPKSSAFRILRETV
jgi:hypothetical protein